MSEVEEQSVPSKQPAPSTDSDQPLEESPTSSSSGGQSVNPPKIRLCKAYKSLDEKLKEQCTRYLLFHRNKQFGAFPDMYVEHDYKGEKKPDEKTSHYFRGGIISTMGVLEAFLTELLEEACTDKRLESKEKGKKIKGFYESQTKSGKKGKAGGKGSEGGTSGEGAGKGGEGGEDFGNIVLFHNWNKMYGKYLFKDKSNLLVDYLFRHPMEYSYVVQNDKISLIKIGKRPLRKNLSLSDRCEMRAVRKEQQGMEDESIICALLRLFYGIRCVMAHGDPDKTLERHALKGFPSCPECHGKCTQVVLDDASDLESYCQKIIKAMGKDQLGRIPDKLKFKEIKDSEDKKGCLEDNEWEDIYRILDLHFSKHDADPLPAHFAFFHMCRVDQWLRKNKIDMHITYRMLVRVNQFIHMLAFRLTIAVATILEEEEYTPTSPSESCWGIQEPGREKVTPITKDEIPNMIRRFEDRHKEIVHQTKETNLVGQGEDEIKEICKMAQKMATEKLKGNKHFMTTPNGVWRVAENEEKIDDKCVIKTYISVVKEAINSH